MLRRLAMAVACALPCASVLPAQASRVQVERAVPDWVGSDRDDRLRLLQLTGDQPLASRMLRPLTGELATGVRLGGSADGMWWGHGVPAARRAGGAPVIHLFDPVLRSVFNSAYPTGGNDGALWAGRGLSAAVDLGAEFRAGALTVRFAPTLVYSQNRPFRLGAVPEGHLPWADPYTPGRIDRPQRFGEDPYTRFDLGQSVVRLDWRGAVVGAGTRNMWWGPGIDNSLLMSSNAPGFPHLFLGTGTPANIGIGKLEAQYVVGRLRASEYPVRPSGAEAPARWLGALAMVWEPRGVPGLYVGGARVFYAYVPDGGLTASDYLSVVQPFLKKKLSTPENPDGDDNADQMLSLFLRWVHPASAFEVYAEFGRNDHNWDSRDLILNPDHSRAYLAGFQKAAVRGERLVRVRGEIMGNARTTSVLTRAVPVWYSHHRVFEGYTHDGQIIGAAAGPGADVQALAVDVYGAGGGYRVFLARERTNDDAYYQRHGSGAEQTFIAHETALIAGIGARRGVGVASIETGISVKKQYNRYFVNRHFGDREVYDPVSVQWTTAVRFR